jgi:hypothetical protein
VSAFRKVLRLSSTDRNLVISAGLLLGGTRLGLWLLPFRAVQRIAARLAEPHVSPHSPNRFSVDRLVWAVTVASRYVPKATCLTQGTALYVLLRREGFPADLRIGIAEGEEGQLQGHAWVESEGRVVIGGPDLGRFTRLPALELERP